MSDLNKPKTSSEDPVKKYPIGSTVKYRRENGEIIDLTVEDYDPTINVFKLTGIVDNLPLNLNMSPKTLDKRTLSVKEMNLKYPIGSSIGYKIRKVSNTGVAGEKVTGEGAVYGFKDGRYIIQMIDGNFTPVKEENLYELDTEKADKTAKQIEKTRTTLQGPISKLIK